MVLIKEASFQFEDKDYKIKVLQEGERFVVRAFLDDAPANGYEYSVEETSTRFDFWHHHGVSAVTHLIETAKADVENKVWETYLDALKKLAKDAEKMSAQ